MKARAPSPRRPGLRTLSLSAALHAVLMLGFALLPWRAEVPGVNPPMRVVWVETPRASDAERESPLVSADLAESNEPRAAEPAAPAGPPGPTTEPDRRAPETPPQPAPTPLVPTNPAGPASAHEPPSVANAPPSEPQPKPPIDWDKARQDAVRGVIEEHAHRPPHLTFSPNDLVKPPTQPIDPAPPPLVTDNCMIVHGRLDRFVAQMLGRCVREARGDLFASIRPAYLSRRPVCTETRPESPGSLLSDGTWISTVKCELVTEERKAATPSAAN